MNLFINRFNREAYHRARDVVEAWTRTNKKKIEQTLGIVIRKPESKLSAIPKTIMLIYLKREVTSEGKCTGMIKYDTDCVVRYV